MNDSVLRDLGAQMRSGALSLREYDVRLEGYLIARGLI